MEFNKEKLTGLTKTICEVTGIEAPSHAAPACVELKNYILQQTNNEKIEKVIMYNPDAIGEWIYNLYYDKFLKFRKNAPYEQKFLTVFPPKTPVCFGSMYTGAEPSVHGIQRYTKPVIKIESIFDSFIKAGKKPCIVAVKNSSMSKIFNERNMDYYFEDYDGEVVKRSIELIKEDKYDLICIYNQEYDDVMHRSHPKSFFSKRAIDHYNDYFDQIANAVKEHMTNYNTLLGCATDHGTHREWYMLRQHGKNIPKDMNIVHFYGVYTKKRVNHIRVKQN